MINKRKSTRSVSSGKRKKFKGSSFKKSFNKKSTSSKKKKPFKKSYNSKSKFGNKTRRKFTKRRRGERIDYNRFIKKAENIEVKTYVSKHTFLDFSFDEQLQKNISRAGYVSPRPIQDQAIPSIIEGKDIFGLANTGTGKTAVFLLPLINKATKDKTEKVLILAPTRELAMQIETEFRNLSFGSGLFGVSVVGGMPINKQINHIKRGVSFVIGTPGRITDLIKRKVLDLSNYKSVVLDEADRMLDMGFINDMIFILSKTPLERQTLFFSATLSPEVKKLTSQFLKDPVFISVISGETAKNIDQDIVRVKDKGHKIERLEELLNEDGLDKILIFREMKYAVNELEKELRLKGFKVGSIHGDKRSRERIRILKSFKTDSITILIATDVAARGLDIPNVTHVINYDVPQNYETYIHRIGRTGRGDKKGKALTFVGV